MKRYRLIQWNLLLAAVLWFCLGVSYMPCQAKTAAQTEQIAKTTKTATKTEDDAPKEIVDPIANADSVSAVLYDNTNGLPTSEANAIAQTSDGFLWLGSYSGLIRYDGTTFERVDPRNGVAGVKSLCADSKDRLWIGTNDGGLVLMKNEKFRFWYKKDGLSSDKVSAIAEGTDGTIYIGGKGVSVMTEEMTLDPIVDNRIGRTNIESLKPGLDGRVYGINNEDDLFILNRGRLVKYFDHKKRTGEDFACVEPDKNHPGSCYIGTAGSTLLYGDPTKGVNKLEEMDITPLSGVIELEQFGDKVWICCLNGIGVLDKDGFHHLPNLPMNNSVVNVTTDYEGNLWFISNRQGVMKLVPNQFQDIFARYNVPHCVVNSTCEYDDKLFIATDTGLIVLGENGSLSELPLKEAKTASGVDLLKDDLLDLMKGVRIRSVIRDSKNRLWISTWRNGGLLCYEKGKVTAYTEKDGLLSDHIRTVVEAPDGSLLVVCTGGLNIIEDGKVVDFYNNGDGITNTESLSAATAPNGDILVGSNGDGIYVINDKGIRTIGTDDGLQSGIIMRIKHDAKRGVFWLVTGNSLAYMTEDYKVTTITNFPYPDNFDLYENSRGEMWILSSDGIYVLPADDLIANEEIKPVHYGIANGLPYIATSNSYSELTEEGDLYIAGTQGVGKVNIEMPLDDISDVKQAIPYVDADGERYYPDKKGAFTLPSQADKITIHSYIFNYSLSDPQVTFQLEGFDKEPILINRSELTPLIYTNLPGGKYHFVLTLKDSFGKESKVIVAPINKKKALYEHAWFHALVIVAGGLLLIILSRAYWKSKITALEQKNKEEAERARVNQELQMAGQIQGGMIPSDFPAFPDHTEFDLYASMTPAREVGGDFYDFFMVDEDHLALVIADVSDKGMPAAMFMAVAKSLVKNQLMTGCDPATAMERVNLYLCDQNQSMMFVTVWLAVVDLSTGKSLACNAGHENPVCRHAGEPFQLLKYRHNLVVGAMETVKYRNREFQLQEGDCLFVYTDGVTEAINAEKELFGEERLVETLNLDPGANPEELIARVAETVESFAGETPQFDDMTMLCMKYKGDGGRSSVSSTSED